MAQEGCLGWPLKPFEKCSYIGFLIKALRENIKYFRAYPVVSGVSMSSVSRLGIVTMSPKTSRPKFAKLKPESQKLYVAPEAIPDNLGAPNKRKVQLWGVRSG